MNPSTFLLLVASLFPSQEPSKDDLAKKDLEKLQGDWKLVAVEQNGVKIEGNASAPDTLFRVEKTKYSTNTYQPWQEIGELKLDPTQKPKAMDATWNEGQNKEVAKAVYDLDGDKLRVAYLRVERMGGAQALFADERPKDFKTKPVEDKTEPHLRVLYFERVKK
ncbi:MAG TPA: TIGR03067 domain-containing protein [Gemmataceae bacterium]|jgi:uncharacterized protein (TIGR03067 family)|nr:TIGR03067 domain-containing protein [Gemmataceae bacterium]